MKLAYYQPAQDLRPYIGSYYSFDTNIPVSLPMCAEFANIRFFLKGEGRLSLPNSQPMNSYDASLIGPTMSWVTLESRTPVTVFGVGILPRGWGAFFGPAALELSDCVIDMEGLLGPCARFLVEQLRNTRHHLDMVSIVDDFFRCLLENRNENAMRTNRIVFPEALDAWLLQPDGMQLDVLLEEMDVSRRQTERLAKQFFGASPKRLQRKYRALHAAAHLTLGESRDWLEAAGDSFYDQSHFIKEIKAFTGFTPKELVSGQGGIMAQSIKMRARATHESPLIKTGQQLLTG